MIWFYCDANALAKRYSKEIGTDLINEIFRRISLPQITALSLSILETVSILVRKKNDGRLPKADFDQVMINLRAELIDAPEFKAATIDDALVFSAVDFIAKHNISSTDAVILRSVLNLKARSDANGDRMILLTSDKRLVKAARNENVIVFDPEVETLASLQTLLTTSPPKSAS